MIWHNATEAQVESELNTNATNGLTENEAELRLKEYGENSFKAKNSISFFKFLLDEFNGLLNISILAIALINFILALAVNLKNSAESLMVILVAVFAIALSATAKYIASLVFEKSSLDGATPVTVIRNGKETAINSTELVPGDIMLIKSGDYIKADGRLIDSYALTCDEYMVSGDVAPSEKIHNTLFEDITKLINRHNMVYSGSYVLNGNGKVIVTETGLSTEIGMHKDMENQLLETETALSTKLNKIKRNASITAIILSFITFTIGIITNFSNTDVSFAVTVSTNILLALSLYFSIGLNLIPSLTTFSRAASVYRLKSKGIVINNESATEELKDITVVCADKTGVLTTEEQTVVKVFNTVETVEINKNTIDDSTAAVLRLALICSNFAHSEHGEKHTNNIERSIETACIKHMGVSKADVDGMYPKIAEIPFDSNRMLMTTVSAINGNPISITKGAPEVILNRCSEINAQLTEEIVTSYAKEGLRVIAVAVKHLSEIPANPNSEELENDLTFVGIIGIEDNISAKAAKVCKEAAQLGIKTIMVTGDHIDTAVAISKKAGIISGPDEAISGEALSALSDDELAECISKYSVFARITPEDKLRIVNALKANGEKVLITGDSVNDAAALSEADFGCALGFTASDLVKDSADIIIEDNHYSSIIFAIRESRKVVSNVKKTLAHLLSVGLSLTLVTVLGLLIFGVQPLTSPSLILFGVISIVVPLIAIFLDKSFSNKSIEHSIKIFEKPFLLSCTVPSLITSVLSLMAYGISGSGTAFVVLFFGLISQAVCLLINGSVLSGNILKQKTSLLICLVAVVLILIAIVSPVSALISLSKFSAIGWLFSILAFVLVFITNEVIKLKA